MMMEGWGLKVKRRESTVPLEMRRLNGSNCTRSYKEIVGATLSPDRAAEFFA